MYTLDQKWHVFGQTNERYDRFTKASSGMFFGGSCTTISGIPSCIKTPEGKCEGERQYYYCYHTACCAHITKFSTGSVMYYSPTGLHKSEDSCPV